MHFNKLAFDDLGSRKFLIFSVISVFQNSVPKIVVCHCFFHGGV